MSAKKKPKLNYVPGKLGKDLRKWAKDRLDAAAKKKKK